MALYKVAIPAEDMRALSNASAATTRNDRAGATTRGSRKKQPGES
jgi:hypothetical protein